MGWGRGGSSTRKRGMVLMVRGERGENVVRCPLCKLAPSTGGLDGSAHLQGCPMTLGCHPWVGQGKISFMALWRSNQSRGPYAACDPLGSPRSSPVCQTLHGHLQSKRGSVQSGPNLQLKQPRDCSRGQGQLGPERGAPGSPELSPVGHKAYGKHRSLPGR